MVEEAQSEKAETQRFIDKFEQYYAVGVIAVSYTHLRAHETVLDLVCRLLLEKQKNLIPRV